MTQYVAVWKFTIDPAHRAAYESVYGPKGKWAALFARAEGYLGTELLLSATDPDTYLTIDRWQSREAFDNFKQKFADEYAALDAECAAFTRTESKVGDFSPLA